jgi:hypothetical protein
MRIKAKYDGQTLHIHLPLETPRPSKTGKTMVVASTYGVKDTTVKFEGRTVVVVANAFFYVEKKRADREKSKSRAERIKQ